ncbi:type VI secretion system baseplate subunit TssF [Xenorhabdus sp. PB62.4]|uniref:type VI secretion system baseplate subunit TssF n=1 Tax=Xenorhabdus sp. PB62.4 TaxID=1851573 RepID=UPI00165726C7|nr:type VI secretion system baseplate subunit TssF [Xenorhabdus sp. PB62.4]MBC8952821.1 hypothetical protein [Xenorhabdus sp. PB62.4]
MDLFKSYFQQERHYLHQFEQLTAEDKNHLADSLSDHNPDIERLNESFAVLMARARQQPAGGGVCPQFCPHHTR